MNNVSTMGAILYMITLLFALGSCVTLNDSKTLVANLLTGYDPQIRPIDNQSATLQVYTSVYVKSIQEFNEVKETFLFTAAFVLFWYDASIVWNPASYGGLTSVMISINNVWVPDLVITTSSSHIVSFGQDWQKVQFLPNGLAKWITGGLVRGTCSINVRNYPFDEQRCSSHFNAGTYYANDVEFVAFPDYVNMSIYSENVVWDLFKSSVSSYPVNGHSQLDVTLKLKRKSSFVVINVLIPLASLSFLNILVFFLVPCSGERVSYSVTVLLAIAVFMTIISDTLTKSSDPVPIISYKLMTDMIISALITVVTILNLSLYHRPDTMEVPKWVGSLYYKVYMNRFCFNKVEPQPKESHDAGVIGKEKVGFPTKITGVVSVIETDDCPETINDPDDDVNDNMAKDPVTWKQVSYMIDFLSIVVFVLVSILSFLTFILYLYR